MKKKTMLCDRSFSSHLPFPFRFSLLSFIFKLSSFISTYFKASELHTSDWHNWISSIIATVIDQPIRYIKWQLQWKCLQAFLFRRFPPPTTWYEIYKKIIRNVDSILDNGVSKRPNTFIISSTEQEALIFRSRSLQFTKTWSTRLNIHSWFTRTKNWYCTNSFTKF